MKTIIFTHKDLAQACADIGNTFDQDGPLAVVYSKLNTSRSHAQNALLHAWISEIRDYWLRTTGEGYSVSVWKLTLKDKLGIHDVILLPDGRTKDHLRSTANYSVGEMAEFLTEIQIYMMEFDLILECKTPFDRLALYDEKIKTIGSR